MPNQTMGHHNCPRVYELRHNVAEGEAGLLKPLVVGDLVSR